MESLHTKKKQRSVNACASFVNVEAVVDARWHRSYDVVEKVSNGVAKVSMQTLAVAWWSDGADDDKGLRRLRKRRRWQRRCVRSVNTNFGGSVVE